MRARLRDEITDPASAAERCHHGAGDDDGVPIAKVLADSLMYLKGEASAEVARPGGADPLGALFNLVVNDNAYARTVYFSLDETDVRAAGHMMTSRPSQRVGLPDRSLLRPDLAADITGFHPSAVIDRATLADAHRLSEDVRCGLVNGQLAPMTDARPGGGARSPRWKDTAHR